MSTLLPKSAVLAWAGLILITLGSWWLGTGHGVSADGANAAVIGLSFVKAWVVARWFMGLASAPRALALTVEVLLASSLAGLVLVLLTS